MSRIEAEKERAQDGEDAMASQRVFDLIGATTEFQRMLHPELQSLHKTARDLFLPRFPELESIILNPVDYAKVVLAIGNEPKVEALGAKLGFLSSTAVLSVTVAFSAARGELLAAPSQAKLTRVCEEILWLDA